MFVGAIDLRSVPTTTTKLPTTEEMPIVVLVVIISRVAFVTWYLLRVHRYIWADTIDDLPDWGLT